MRKGKKVQHECLYHKDFKADIVLKIGTRKIDLEGEIMNLGLCALNLRYQQYVISLYINNKST